MAPVVQELNLRKSIESIVCVTAQHREMLDQVLDLFKIRADYDLDLMTHDQSLASLTAGVFTGLDPVLRTSEPDWILVQGDTTTVMAASLLAYYHRINVGHVEAGLRTADKWQPFPEEINRRVAGTVADLHFAPTKWAQDNLLSEGVPREKIVITGNPVIDALQHVIEQPYDLSSGPLQGIPDHKRIILVTAHRRENFGEPMRRIFSALISIAQTHARDVVLIYPVHLNPNVHDLAYEMLSDIENIKLLDPLNYLPMVHLMARAHLVLTDSGGLQEEAPALGTPVLVLRDVTERPEAIEAGTARLVGTDFDRIVEQTQILLEDEEEYAKMAKAINPFGDGHAATRIVDAILESA